MYLAPTPACDANTHIRVPSKPGLTSRYGPLTNATVVMPYWYKYVVDASELTVGKQYSLCVDLDGNADTTDGYWHAAYNNGKRWGYTGVEVFVSNVQELHVDLRETRSPTLYSLVGVVWGIRWCEGALFASQFFCWGNRGMI